MWNRQLGAFDSLPTVRDVLELPSVRNGLPAVLAGENFLDSEVHWAHVCEQPDMERFLNGGELVLTSGTGLGGDPEEWIPLIDAISDCGATALVIELGRYYTQLPDTVTARANARGLPLITLQRSIRFVDVTHAIHKMIKDKQSDELQQRVNVHEIFTQLTVSGADADTIVAHVGKMLECSVVLENVAHQVLACHAHGGKVGELLDGWEQRSRNAVADERTSYQPELRWLVTKVGAHDETWGRLIILLDDPSARHMARTIAERAADALTLRRLIERDQETLEHQSQRSLLTSILTPFLADTDEIVARARTLGVELVGRQLIGGSARIKPAGRSPAMPRSAEAQHREYITATERAVAECDGVAVLAASNGKDRLVLVVSADPDVPIETVLDGLAPRIHQQLGLLAWPVEVSIGFGSAVRTIGDVALSCTEARNAASAGRRFGRGRSYYRLADFGVLGLLHLLRDDTRVQAFVERELGDLLSYDQRHGTDLVHVLRVFLDHGQNKSTTARELFLSRPSLYERLGRIEQTLGLDVTDSDVALSLHVALYALDCMRSNAENLQPLPDKV